MAIVFLFYLAVIGLISGLASYVISQAVYRKLVRAGDDRANTIRVVIFISSFLILGITAAVVVFKNMSFER